MTAAASPSASDPVAASGTAPVLLRVTDLQTHFVTDAGRVHAVDGVDLTVRRGQTVALVGESGSGKSVTGLSIMRLLQRTPARLAGGEIQFTAKDGVTQDLVRLPEARMRAIRGGEIAMIFQDPMASLNPVFPIGEQIVEAIVTHRTLGRRAARAEAARLLDQVGIAEARRRLDDYPHQLSGGMRQRVMIAVALACDPVLLIADEPTTALDVTIQAQIIALLRRIQTERAMGMIFITHDLGLVEEIADRVAVLYAGQVVEEAPVETVLARPRHPYTRALLDCNPHRVLAGTIGAGSDLRPIPGRVPDLVAPLPGCRFAPRCGLAAAACRTETPVLRPVGSDQASRCLFAEAVS